MVSILELHMLCQYLNKNFIQRKNPCKFKNCNFSKKFSKQILNLPIFPSMKKKEIEYIVNSLRNLMNE